MIPEKLDVLSPTTGHTPFVFGFSTHTNIAETRFDIHCELEIGVVLCGEMNRHWDDTHRLLQPGDIWLTGVWEAHGFSLKTVPCDVAVFLVRPEVLAAVHLGIGETTNWLASFALPPNERPGLKKEYRQQLMEHLIRVKHNIDVSTDAATPPATASFLTLLSLLEHLGVPGQTAPNAVATKMERITPAVELVFQSRYPVLETQGARSCHMSVSTFRRKFRSAMGVSFGQFALHHRLKSASIELSGPRSIAEIADRWGFSDVSHFHRTFKKIFQQTPANYRRNIRAAPK